MKPTSLASALLWAGLLPLVGSLPAEDKKPDPFIKKDTLPAAETSQGTAKRMNLLHCCELIEVSLDQYHAWQASHPAADDRTLRGEVQQWIQAKQASVLDTSFVASLPGRRSLVTSVREQIFPTSFDSSGPGNAYPATFETQNVGQKFELDASLNPSGTIDIACAPERVEAGGEFPPVPELEGPVQKGDIRWPVFRSWRPTLSIAMATGECRLLGSAPCPADPARARLFFLRSEAAAPEASAKSSGSSQVRIRFECFDVPQDLLAADLEKETLQSLAGETLRKQALASLTDGTGRLGATLTVQTTSGQRVRLDADEQHRYAKEFTPGKNDEMPSHPQHIMVRTIGFTAEFDPVVDSAGGFADISFSFDQVTRSGDSVHSRRLDNQGRWVPDVTMPIFYVERITSQVTVSPGKPFLVGITTPPGPDGTSAIDRKRLVFLTVDF